MTKQQVANSMLAGYPFDAGGGGAVDSVNGETGAVVLDAADVGAATPASVTSAITAHAALADPHTGYLTQTEGDARYPLKTDPDPYPTYLTQTEAGALYEPFDSAYTKAEADARYLTQIADGSVTSAKIADGTIATADLANGAVTNAKLAADTARANLLTNGGFEVWQRGNGPFTTLWAADRWSVTPAGTDVFSVSRDTGNVDVGSLYCAAVTFTLGTGAGSSSLAQSQTEVYQSLRGKTVTVSARVKTSVANGIRFRCNDGPTGVLRGGFHSGSGAYETISLTYPVASNATQFAINFEFDVSGTYYLDNAMLVVGSVAAEYAPLHPADELIRCQRYYELIPNGKILLGSGAVANGGAGWVLFPFKATKAVTPTVTLSGALYTNGSGGAADAGGVSTWGAPAYYLVTTGTGQSDFSFALTVEANP